MINQDNYSLPPSPLLLLCFTNLNSKSTLTALEGLREPGGRLSAAKACSNFSDVNLASVLICNTFCLVRVELSQLLAKANTPAFVLDTFYHIDIGIDIDIEIYRYKYLGVGSDNPFQYSYLQNSMGRGAWWATVHGVTKSQT